MARRYISIGPIDLIQKDDLPSLVDAINEKIVEINEAFTQFAQAESQLRGEDGNTIKLSGNIDLSGKRITNAKRSASNDDYVTRREMSEFGIYNPNPGRALRVDNKLEFIREVIVPIGTSENSAVNLSQIEQAISTGIGAEVAVIRDGNPIDLEDVDGVDGATGGTLMFGAKSEDILKARPIRVTEKGVIVDNSTLEELMFNILLELKSLNEKLGG